MYLCGYVCTYVHFVMSFLLYSQIDFVSAEALTSGNAADYLDPPAGK